MMIQSKKNIITGLLVASVSSISAASGFDRGVVPPDFLYEKGGFAQFSFASAAPNVSGKVTASPKAGLEAQAAQAEGVANMLPNDTAVVNGLTRPQYLALAAQARGAAALMPSAGADTGKLAQDYTRTGLSFKQDYSDKISFGIQLTQPAGLNVQYAQDVIGANIDLQISAIDALVKYQINESISVFGGPRLQYVAESTFGNNNNGSFEAESAEEVGYTFGMGYKNPYYHTQLLVSYTSAIEIAQTAKQVEVGPLLTVPGEQEFYVNTPAQIQLAVKQPLSQNSMIMATYRMANWSDSNIGSSVTGLEQLSDYKDVEAYVLGYGHKINNELTLLGSYTRQTGSASLYSPVNDRDGLAFMGRYHLNDFRVDAGVIYYQLHDATTTLSSAAGDIEMEFEGNDALAYTLRLGYSF